MARDTDQKIISETIRLRTREQGDLWAVRDGHDINIDMATEHPLPHTTLEIEYSDKGRITKLVHWQPIEHGSRLGSRTPITKDKRNHALAVIKGEWEA